MEKVIVPWPEKRIRKRIGSLVIAAHCKIEKARLAENEAVTIVESAIENAGGS